ncbi:hypothetical protein BRN32_05160 [Xanthomonas oryzae pv. oryzae]|nr:hypothetical protein BRN32_05160 [Xanthomonas oryzae pv. oryzae]
MPPHSEQIVSRICGALFRGPLTLELTKMRIREATQCADARDAGSVRQPRRFLWLRYMRAHQARDQRVSAVVRVSGMCLSIRRDTARSGRVARA